MSNVDIFFEQRKVLVGSGQGRKPKRTVSPYRAYSLGRKQKGKRKKKLVNKSQFNDKEWHV